MKRILIAAMALCLVACASTSEKEAIPDQSTLNTKDGNSQTGHPPTHKVFKDDFERLLLQTGASKRLPVILGRKSSAAKTD